MRHTGQFGLVVMTETLERLRRQLDQLITEAEKEAQAETEAREAAIAQAMEELSTNKATQAAYNQGRYDLRRDILMLIDEQRQTLRSGGLNALSLDTLKNHILSLC